MEKFMLCTLMLFVMTGFVHVNGILHLGSECSQTGNTTGNTIYQANLKTLLDSLVNDSPLQGGFLNTTIGTGSNQVYGLAWCRADVSPITCSKCLNESISVPLRDCPESKDLVIWSSLCSLRFSNESFFGELWNSSSSSSYGGNTLDEASVFSRGFAMMEALGRNVSDRPLMFDTDVIDAGNDGKRYGLGQCSRDLSKLDCENCLEELLVTYRRFVMNRTGWEMLGVSCGLWYDDVQFSDDDSGLTPTPIGSGVGERLCTGDYVILAFVAFLLFHWIA
ncbi:cysteine-rich repeat secretory protein 38 [Lactuca sativa]|uniref:Gnk2-homologous domain-containing protein n=1 Tax=Lactuca sativa TaxID=4236 RepID=A0A9R1V166_LACSA|nr:cysteine-rich repeat secretory protein 38 [Lactuca sativa]KAJ0196455.1 hypothetical protein LSAT_V11C700349600 [Lactuca sativa]